MRAGWSEHFVEEYNTKRLHGAIGYVTPHDRLEGRHTQIWEERDRKLEAARARRTAQREQARSSNQARFISGMTGTPVHLKDT